MNARLCLTATALASALAGAVWAAPEVIEVNDLKKEVPQLAKKILEIVAGEEQTQVAVGRFIGPAQHDANFGPGVEKLLSQALEELQAGVVNKKAHLSVQGAYAFVNDKINTGRVLVKLRVEILDRAAERVAEFIAELRGNGDIATFGGVTIAMPPEGTKKQRNKDLKKRIDNPQVFVRDTMIKASEDSSFAVEIRVKDKGDSAEAIARRPSVEDGQAFVDIPRDEVYELVIHNNSTKEIAVAITIDGVDVFHLSEDVNPKTAQKFSHYIIGAGKSSVIEGWHLRGNKFSRFLVSDYGKGVASKTPEANQGKIGVLTVSFSFSHPPGSRGETGQGPIIEREITPVERGIDAPHEFVTVRYSR